jgi:hypothetical protein
MMRSTFAEGALRSVLLRRELHCTDKLGADQQVEHCQALSSTFWSTLRNFGNQSMQNLEKLPRKRQAWRTIQGTTKSVLEYGSPELVRICGGSDLDSEALQPMEEKLTLRAL